MSWRDIFYPGNPERREMLIRKNQELQDLMKNNFRATNKLIETLKKHLQLSFSPIALNEKATVQENCDIIIGCIHEIQAEVEKIGKKLKEKLDPTLYEKLKDMNLSVHDLTQVARHVSIALGTVGMASSLVVSWLITSGRILTNLKLTFVRIATGLAAGVALGVVFMGVDMIVQAILGSIERDQLEKSLKEYDEALEQFGLASEKYQDSITYVRVRIEMIEE
ncbi:single-pass membrane and coiled-coil domain-containing protein 3-like [Carassius carassius]|uniref:single-pass membrane and coiled-coil domain-containing protein 3-like n=1 Tax=Carassius carassius TaxID=217509 RepID=UPI0028689E04|nr:single-pass membrane and coiled-coil domain-containing protein 3-like [Carassius carassius]